MKKISYPMLFLALAFCTNASAEQDSFESSKLLLNNSSSVVTPAMDATAALSYYHYPVINFTEIKQHVLNAFLKTEKQFGITKKPYLKHQQTMITTTESIEELLASEYWLEQKLSESTNINKNQIDKTLVSNILSIKGDPYTRFEEIVDGGDPQVATKPAAIVTTFKNGDMKISSFDAPHCTLQPSMINNGMTIDLTNNGGGNIQCSLDALSAFLPLGKHLVGKLITNDFTKDLYVTGTQSMPIKGTLKVNNHTASSAEFFMGVLKKFGWKVDGGKTFGKIVTQYQFPSTDGNIYITFGHYKVI